jgi:hypothetical protein
MGVLLIGDHMIKTGINVFETTKLPDSIPFDGVRIRFGAGFTQQFQSLKHENPTALNTQSPPSEDRRPR